MGVTNEKNRVVYVPASFRETWVERKVWTRKKGKDSWRSLWGIRFPVFTREERSFKTSTSDCEIDGEQLAEDLRAAVLALNEQGYEVVSVTPITSGQFSPQYDRRKRSRNVLRNAMRQIGYGYSFTEGMVVVAVRESS
ncbi:MAG: hypothetical protein AAGA96_01270 [Verrucomicrobiota bacterium]